MDDLTAKRVAREMVATGKFARVEVVLPMVADKCNCGHGPHNDAVYIQAWFKQDKVWNITIRSRKQWEDFCKGTIWQAMVGAS